ncbi:MAG: flagellar hook-basal body complex protein FliE [Roseomonas sp.]|nr:flagellar hook-basal body complex protein FliE [Roseomonas sp.]MCA3326055.1 flagellar hook-basal body complex protein FliE [Roseomonas sp.]MCA3332224.1 flagellar hook-basal body complex protein FliE [Roseomonas sp.]MCA3335455.1 flagellar hook-basal body complex protein FliE [Roseomonas sp.]MCA3347504.1 flagellar hook-basal body complex protein FliE [Roseomonas sp.]
MPLPLTPGGAAAAYRANMAAPSAAVAATGAGETASFGETLSRAVQNAVTTSREAEAASARGLMGQGSVTDLVVAVGRAELTLQTAVAVRDRVVAAYQEVMRMPI